jgi:uncharacterized RDD family membrane protein YckC
MSLEGCRNHPDATGPIVPCTRCGGSFCSDCIVNLQGRPYCATCKNEHVRDVSSGVDATQLPLASVGRRFAAIFVDQLIFGVPILAVMFAIGMFSEGTEEPPCGFLAAFGVVMLLGLLYEPLMLTRWGATVGKRAMGIRVVRPDGSKISAGQAWGRFGIKSILGIISYITVFMTPEKTCVHDIAAKTRVIRV